MTEERYEKWGVTLRRERMRAGETTTRLDEHGLARSSDSRIDSESLKAEPGRVTGLMPLPILEALDDPHLQPAIERFILTSGAALHVLKSGDRSSSWSTVQQRLHISLVHGRHRVEWNLSCEEQSHSDLSMFLIRTVEALSRAGQLEAPRTAVVNLAPAVAAQFWRALVFSRESLSLPQQGLRMQQRPHHDGEIDGTGEPVRLLDLSEQGASSAVYRASYRTRSVRLPHNVHVWQGEQEPGEVEEAEVSILALTRGPKIGGAGRLEAVALCRDHASNSVFIASIRVSPAEFCAGVGAIGRDLFWFPEVAGVYGSDTQLRRLELFPL